MRVAESIRKNIPDPFSPPLLEPMGPHLLPAISIQVYARSIRDHRINPAAWAESCDSICCASRFDLPTVNPICDL